MIRSTRLEGRGEVFESRVVGTQPPRHRDPASPAAADCRNPRRQTVRSEGFSKRGSLRCMHSILRSMVIKSIAYRRRRIKFVFSADGPSCGTVTFWGSLGIRIHRKSEFTAKARRSQSETQCGVESNPFLRRVPSGMQSGCVVARGRWLMHTGRKVSPSGLQPNSQEQSCAGCFDLQFHSKTL